ARSARPPRDAWGDRLARRRRQAAYPHQLSDALPYARRALTALRPYAGQNSCLRGTRWRRLRRQTGDDHRGYRGGGRAQDRTTGDAGVYTCGAVFGVDKSPPHAHHHQGRRSTRWPLDRDLHADAFKYWRLRQSWSRRYVSWLRGIGRSLPMSQQEDRQLCGLHPPDAQRRLPRLWPEPDEL